MTRPATTLGIIHTRNIYKKSLRQVSYQLRHYDFLRRQFSHLSLSPLSNFCFTKVTRFAPEGKPAHI